MLPKSLPVPDNTVSMVERFCCCWLWMLLTRLWVRPFTCWSLWVMYLVLTPVPTSCASSRRDMHCKTCDMQQITKWSDRTTHMYCKPSNEQVSFYSQVHVLPTTYWILTTYSFACIVSHINPRWAQVVAISVGHCTESADGLHILGFHLHQSHSSSQQCELGQCIDVCISLQLYM